MNRQLYFFRGIGFGDKIKRAGLHGPDNQLGIILMTDDNNRGAGRIPLQVFNAVDEMRSVIRKVQDNDTESLFLQALSGFLNIGRGTDGVIGRQGVSQFSGFTFILTDQQQ